MKRTCVTVSMGVAVAALLLLIQCVVEVELSLGGAHQTSNTAQQEGQ
jgi:hypothetical protein